MPTIGDVAIIIDYAVPGPFTVLDDVPAAALEPVAGDPVGICWPVHSLDSELLGGTVLDRPDRLAEGEFLCGGEAWPAFRRGDVDASQYGVHGTQNWGPAEIRGNAVKDFAALNKIETLPWDEWGRMTDAYDGKTGTDYDELLDTLASTCAADDSAAVAAL